MESSLGRPVLTNASFADGKRKLRQAAIVFVRGVAVDRPSVTMTEISEHGCLLEQSNRLAVGSYIVLSIAAFTPMGATVALVEGGAVGLQFVDTLHPSIVDHIANQLAQ